MRGYQQVLTHREALAQLQPVAWLATSFDADAYAAGARSLGQVRQDILLLRYSPCFLVYSCVLSMQAAWQVPCPGEQCLASIHLCSCS